MTHGAARLPVAAVSLAAVIGVAGCGGPDHGAAAAVRPAATSAAPAPSVTSVTSAASSSSADGFTSPRTYREVSPPTRVRIPAAGVDSRLGRVGLAADGTIAAPAQWQQAAWYDRGPRPGQDGPAVIVGHVDSTAGPAVFARVGRLRAGQPVLVDRADGSTETFVVTRRRQFAKARFPASEVYAPTLRPSLLLITCGGSFDATSGHYRDNVVVTAVPG